MTIDFVRPMGVPPVHQPRPAATTNQPANVDMKPVDESQRPVAPDPVRGNAVDVKA